MVYCFESPFKSDLLTWCIVLRLVFIYQGWAHCVYPENIASPANQKPRYCEVTGPVWEKGSKIYKSKHKRIPKYTKEKMFQPQKQYVNMQKSVDGNWYTEK